jgi:hypothetical protein
MSNEVRGRIAACLEVVGMMGVRIGRCVGSGWAVIGA